MTMATGGHLSCLIGQIVSLEKPQLKNGQNGPSPQGAVELDLSTGRERSPSGEDIWC